MSRAGAAEVIGNRFLIVDAPETPSTCSPPSSSSASVTER